MWYLLLWLGFAIWVFFDSKNRRTNKGALWAVGALFAGVVVLPIYFAKRNLYAGEVREGGTGWNTVKVFALYWTLTMFVAGIAGLGSASRVVSDASSSAEQAGATIGSMLGLGLLIGLWFAVLVGTLVIGLFLKKSSVVENGPTGELVGQEAPAKKLGVWMLAVWIVIACVGVLVTSGKKESNGLPEQASANSDKFAELAAMQPAPLSPTGELAAMFNLGSDNTNLQRENKLKEIKGKVVEWTLPVYEVKKDGHGYKVQTATGDTVGTFIYISPRNDQDKTVIEALKTGSQISIKGIIKDDSMRCLVIKPAILFQPGSVQPVAIQATQPAPAMPVAEQAPAEQATQQNAGVCAEIFKQEELNAGDNAVQCSNHEFEIADKELNSTYKSITASLTPDRKAVLKSEQIAWVKTKEVECDAAMQGHMNPRHMDIAKNDCLVEKTNQRTAYLKSFR